MPKSVSLPGSLALGPAGQVQGSKPYNAYVAKQYMLALVHVVRPLSQFTSITADQCPARTAAGPIPYDSERW
jgi:hypothetical protein